MTWQWIVLQILLLLVTGFVFYMVGKRSGYKFGKTVTESELPIMMRLRVLQTGRCPVCDTVHGNMVQCCKRGD